MVEVQNNATLGERKNMNLPGVKVELPTITPKDEHDIVDFGLAHNVDFIAASFVRKGSDIGACLHAACMLVCRRLCDAACVPLRVCRRLCVACVSLACRLLPLLRSPSPCRVCVWMPTVHPVSPHPDVIREVLGPAGRSVQIIAKVRAGSSPRACSGRAVTPASARRPQIENQEGLENFDEILAKADGIMVARGDLGMEIAAEKVFLAQKMMIRKCNVAVRNGAALRAMPDRTRPGGFKACAHPPPSSLRLLPLLGASQGKVVITATQMLESMINNPRSVLPPRVAPRRAELICHLCRQPDARRVHRCGERSAGRH